MHGLGWTVGWRTGRRWALVGGLGLALAGCDEGSDPVGPVEPIVAVEVAPDDVALALGDTIRLVATARTQGGQPVLGVGFVWSSDRQDRAHVDGGGLVRAMGGGNARIRVSVNGLSAWADVAVESDPEPTTDPMIASLDPAAIQQGWGDFTVVVRGTGFAPNARTWFGDIPLQTVVLGPAEIHATVPAGAVVYDEPVTITVENPGPSGAVSPGVVFAVNSRPALSVDMLVGGNGLFPGNRMALDAVARDQFGEIIPGKTITWVSDNPSVAVIDGGHLRGVAAGWTTLRAHAYPTSAAKVVQVLAPPSVDLAFEAATTANRTELFLRSLMPGGGVRRLNPPGVAGSQPAPSPDGTRIAFTGEDSTGRSLIRVLDRTGGNATLLHAGPGTSDQPTWSPNGVWIAFRNTSAGKSDIWVVRADGSGLRNLTEAEVYVPGEFNERPAWSPDSQRIVFTRGFGVGMSLFTVRPDGSELKEMTSRAGVDLLEPAWSPDGQMLAYRERSRTTGEGRIAFISSATGNPIQPLMAELPDARTPTWLGGDWLAVAARAHPGSTTPTIALVRLGSGIVVLPMGADTGRMGEPAGVVR